MNSTHVARLESYLRDTRQLNALELRQARWFAARVQNPDQKDNAHAFLLLMLSTLHRGAAGATHAFWLEPLSIESIRAFSTEQENPPEWMNISADDYSAIFVQLLKSPHIFSPLHQFIIVDKQQQQISFARTFDAVQRLTLSLHKRLQNLREMDATLAQNILAPLFNEWSFLGAQRAFHPRQAAACALALRTNFLILSGGPGTGKTSVVIQILRTLMRAFPQIAPDRIALCAPTGRAKARMGESVRKGIVDLQKQMQGKVYLGYERDMALLDLHPLTLHALLKQRPNGSYAYNAAHPLPQQVIVVDEASMVDLHLFAGLLDACAPDAHIILLGDMHQLPSVEAGAVLGDLTQKFLVQEGFPTLSANMASWVSTCLAPLKLDAKARDVQDSFVDSLDASLVTMEPSALVDHTVVLTHTYRSSADILSLCTHINRGDCEKAVLQLHTMQQFPDLRSAEEAVRAWLTDHYLGANLRKLQGLNESQGALACAFEVLDASRILALSHAGASGRIAINRMAEKLLRKTLDPQSKGAWFHGQMVILEQNHHDLDLFNGDLGIVMRTKIGLQVVFKRGDEFRFVAVERLAGLESAYAMTVHKSQGSEFTEVLLALPEHASPLLTRQILYTGITRAKSLVKIFGNEAIFVQAICKRDERPGGIRL